MKTVIRHLALGTALGAGALAGTDYLLADEKPRALSPEDVKKLLEVPRGRAAETPPAAPGRVGGNAANPTGDSKPDKDVAPVKVTLPEDRMTAVLRFAASPDATAVARHCTVKAKVKWNGQDLEASTTFPFEIEAYVRSEKEF